jgi:hypothetical protein
VVKHYSRSCSIFFFFFAPSRTFGKTDQPSPSASVDRYPRLSEKSSSFRGENDEPSTSRPSQATRSPSARTSLCSTVPAGALTPRRPSPSTCSFRLPHHKDTTTVLPARRRRDEVLSLTLSGAKFIIRAPRIHWKSSL